jgi:hypothetical protein
LTLNGTTTAPSDAQAPEYYMQGAAGSLAAMETDSTGTGGFLNVPPGDYVVTATPLVLGKPASHVYVFVEAGTITGALMYPTP